MVSSDPAHIVFGTARIAILAFSGCIIAPMYLIAKAKQDKRIQENKAKELELQRAQLILKDEQGRLLRGRK